MDFAIIGVENFRDNKLQGFPDDSRLTAALQELLDKTIWLKGTTPQYLISGVSAGVIQAAIDAAVAAGHGPTNPCVIQIAPGTYTENLTLKEGIHLVAKIPNKTYSVSVIGYHTFAAAAALPASVNMVMLDGIDLKSDGVSPTLTFSGLNPQILRFFNSEINAADGGQSPLVINNSGSGSYVLVQNGNVNTTAGAAPAVTITVGKLAMTLGQANAASAGNRAIVMAATNTGMELSNSYTTGGITSGGLAVIFATMMNTSLTPAIDGAGNLVIGRVTVMGGGNTITGPTVVPVNQLG